jgi:hypothetical protein
MSPARSKMPESAKLPPLDVGLAMTKPDKLESVSLSREDYNKLRAVVDKFKIKEILDKAPQLSYAPEGAEVEEFRAKYFALLGELRRLTE